MRRVKMMRINLKIYLLSFFSLVLSKEILLQAVFDKDKLKTIPDYWKPGTTEISLLVLATFLLICCIICIYVVCVKHQMYV